MFRKVTKSDYESDIIVATGFSKWAPDRIAIVKNIKTVFIFETGIFAVLFA